MLCTPLCSLLGITHPILNASMAGTATGTLAAAVSEAGGFGMIGGTNAGGAEWLQEQIDLARSLTARPFGVGFISAFPDTEELARVALDAGVAAINHSFADPTPFVAPTHAAGAKLFVQVQTLASDPGGRSRRGCHHRAGWGRRGQCRRDRHLRAAAGHRRCGGAATVVAAGGIADGRGLAAALLLGAQGAWMGTRFVTSLDRGGPTGNNRQCWPRPQTTPCRPASTMSSGNGHSPRATPTGCCATRSSTGRMGAKRKCPRIAKSYRRRWTPGRRRSCRCWSERRCFRGLSPRPDPPERSYGISRRRPKPFCASGQPSSSAEQQAVISPIGRQIPLFGSGVRTRLLPIPFSGPLAPSPLRPGILAILPKRD